MSSSATGSGWEPVSPGAKIQVDSVKDNDIKYLW